MKQNRKILLSSAIAAICASAQAQDNTGPIEEVFVLSQKTTYANNVVDDNMLAQQSSMTSVLAVIDNVPGVLINEGDVYGSDDWSTTVSIRGFQLSLDEQQIGMTVDGIPNGNSNYGGGSKANRYVDTENLSTVEVSQGTADIASRSHEALGGSLNFITQSPEDEERARVSVTLGDYSAKKYYFRYDTGQIWGNTKAYFSYSDMDVNAWIDQSGETNRNHAALKLESDFSWGDITAYASYDDTHEDNYQRVTLSEYNQNPNWDRLTDDWSGSPFIDQVYRRGWSTLRENYLSYVKFEFEPSESFSLHITPYYHDNEGRGDWLPPYIVEVTDDGAGNPHSELNGLTTVEGGAFLGTFTYVDRDGAPLTPADNCASLTFPYGGTRNDDPATEADESSGLSRDPACFPSDAIPVGSYRHTHYEKERFGISGDLQWNAAFGSIENELRAGFWFEDQTRYESRDWHKIIDSRSSYHFEQSPYWIQYDRDYPQETFMVYLEDSMTLGDLTVRLGAKQWYVDIERNDNFDSSASGSVSSDSDLLPSAGILWQASDSFELFAGYAENFAAIKDVVLEAADLANNPQALDDIEPETAVNMDIGVRFTSDRLQATATYYNIEFDNRITFLAPGGDAAPDFLSELDGEYRNVGGIESDGFELSATWMIDDYWSLYTSYTLNDSTYVGLDRLAEFETLQDQIDYEESLGIYRGNTVFGAAEDMYVVSLDWVKDQYSAGFTTKHVGERYMDAANNNQVNAYDVADVYFAVSGDSIGDFQGYELRFTVNNVFNADYIGGVAGGWGGWIGGGRTAAFNFLLDF
jgi:iron complex outermembrane receptor protein